MGCCKSTPLESLEKSDSSQPIPSLRFGRPQSQENLENYVVVWLDPAIKRNANTLKSKIKLQKWVHVVNIFIDPNECRAYMRSIINEKIFLIVSGELGEQFIPTIQDLPQLDSIYILSSDKDKDQKWARQFPDIYGVYETIDPLCEQLGKDVKMCEHDLVGLEVIERSVATKITPETANRLESMFMYDQLFREIVLSMKEEDLKDMFAFCEKYYYDEVDKDDVDSSIFLSKFKTAYHTKTAAYWYTYESFLYRILNKALACHQYNTSYELRVFIRHLHERIVRLQKKNNPNVKKLYRGQGLDRDEFNRIRNNEGGLVSFANFLSTSTSREIALEFAQRVLRKRKKISVVMEIQIKHNSLVPFADVTKDSAIEDEEEWLFSMGSTFRIGSVEQRPDRIWSIHLTLTDENDEQLAALRQHYENYMKYANHFFNLAKLMCRIANWERAEYFYKKSLQIESSWQRRAVIYSDLASVETELRKYDEAAQHYQKSIDINMQQLVGDNTDDLASTYNNLGTLYYKQKKLDLAKENFEKADTIYRSQGRNNGEFIATIYSNMANVLNDQGNHKDALKYSRKCLAIQLNHPLPEIHPNLALTYGNMASILHSQRDFKQALDYAQRSIDIDERVLPPNHPQTQMHRQTLEAIKKSLVNSRR